VPHTIHIEVDKHLTYIFFRSAGQLGLAYKFSLV
jgi:hypothetical protein